MHKIFLGLGSNVGDKKKYIEEAIHGLERKITHITLAPLVETKPMYYEKQDVFLNTVLRGYTELSVYDLFSYIKATEQHVGRIPRFRNGPREIDIDILFYDNLIVKNKLIEIPHPRIAERDFVLKPFIAIEHEFIHPILNKTMQTLYDELTITA